MNRRDFLKLIISIPVLGGVALFASPLFRYLRPTSGPLIETGINTHDDEGKLKDITQWQGKTGLFTDPDAPTAESVVQFSLGDFPSPWSVQTFTFGQKSKEYTFKHFQSTKIPGFVVRLPDNQQNGQPDFLIVSRICPHMGCVFNFEPPDQLGGYNYPQATHPHFACPCHLSVYDPLQLQDSGSGERIRGKVVSGPAPRPPRLFSWEIAGDMLKIVKAESGDIS